MKLSIQTPKGKYRYKFVPIYEGIKPIDKAVARENLFLLQDICRRGGVDFLLFYGTLLGALREKDFIAHDEDIDLAMPKERMDDFLSLLFSLREEGFEVVRYERRGFMSIMRKGEYIDFYFFHPYPEHAGLDCCAREIVPSKYIRSTSTIEFLGRSFTVPAEGEGFLEFYYGAGWRTPVQCFNYGMSPLRRFKAWATQYCKALLPVAVTEALQRRKDAPIQAARLRELGF